MKTGGGYLVISLDFELHWGMFDKVSVESYGEHYKGVQKVLPEILASFKQHNVHATWATVGMLMTDGVIDLVSTLPRESLRPRYEDMRVSSYTHIDSAHIGQNEKEDPAHFAPSLVREIQNTNGQELASHTFSHYYCLDGDDNRQSVFDADFEAQKTIFARFNTTPSSIVFPRNQATEKALILCHKHGINAYRGTESHRMYRPRKDADQSLYIRALRLVDAYYNLSGHNTTPITSLIASGIHNIPSSRFLRPYSTRARFFENRKLKRIKKSMTHAAKNNEIFHLWWHPHNFGLNRKENMQNLEDILAHYELLRETYGMQSRNMREIATIAETAV